VYLNFNSLYAAGKKVQRSKFLPRSGGRIEVQTARNSREVAEGETRVGTENG
jgi:hypothetical protein